MEDIILKIANKLPEIKFLEILEDIEKYLPQEDGNQHRFVPWKEYDNDHTYYLYIDIHPTYVKATFNNEGITISKACSDALGKKHRFWEWSNPQNGYDPKVIAGWILHG